MNRVILTIVFLILFSINPASATSEKQMIVIGVDGFQYRHYNEMLEAGNLTNFTRLINRGGWNGNHKITGHNLTNTEPGNAEIHTGLNETINLISVNYDPDTIPANLTTFERLKNFNNNIKTGMIYGKTRTSLLEELMPNAISSLDWYKNQDNYLSEPWIVNTTPTYCDNSLNVSIKATEFLNNSKEDSFYLFVYFGVLDCTGHVYFENSTEYDLAMINVDEGIGILLNYLKK